MGSGRYQTQFAQMVAGGVSPTGGGAEVVLMTTPPFELPIDAPSVYLLARLIMTVGVGGTSITLRFRRGTTIGATQVDVTAEAVTVVAGNVVAIIHIAVDTPGIVAGVQYSLTGIAFGGVAAWTTFQDSTILAMVL